MWPALIGAAGSIIGGGLNFFGSRERNDAQADQARQATQASQAMAREQMAFQERMSSTAYQRGMADMRSAGLNPILAYSQGGASSPAGAMGQASMAQLENTMEGLGEGVSSAAQKAKDAAHIPLATAQSNQAVSQTDLNKASEAMTRELELKARADTAVSAEQRHKVEADRKLTEQETLNSAIRNQILVHDVTTAEGESRIRQRTAQDTENWGPSILGQQAGGLERILKRLFGAAEKRFVIEPSNPQQGKISFGDWLRMTPDQRRAAVRGNPK